jgi:hypothetical protein
MVRATDLPRGVLPVRLPAQTICRSQRQMSVSTPFLLRLKSIARWLALK